MKKILDLFNKYSESEYKEFTSSLIPNINKGSILGVRIPNIRKIVKLLSEEEINLFLLELPHTYLEENILHSLLINNISDFDRCIYELDRFLPFVDHWSVCDTLKCDILSSNLDKFYDYIV